MTDVIVRPEGPLARGSDRRAKIAFRPGGSAANQAAWLASFGVEGRFRRPRRRGRRRERDGAACGDRASRRISPATPSVETGRLIALIDPDGERSFLTDRGANEALEASDIPDALIAGAALIHLSGYSFFAPRPRTAVLDVMRRAGEKPVSVDPASAEFLREAGADNFLAWTRGASILFPNAEEAAILAGSDDPETQCARLAALYPLVVVKRGAAGCEAAAGARRWRVAAPPVEAIDTTGAGDAFVAAFLAERLAGADIEAALARGAAAGALASTVVGGRPGGETRRSFRRLTRPLLHRAQARLGLGRLRRVVYGAERDRPHQIGRKPEPHQIAFVEGSGKQRRSARGPEPAGIDRSNGASPIPSGASTELGSKPPEVVARPFRIEGRAAVTCHARGLGDKTLLGHRVAEADRKAGRIGEVGLRAFQAVVGERRIEAGLGEQRQKRRRFCAIGIVGLGLGPERSALHRRPPRQSYPCSRGRRIAPGCPCARRSPRSSSGRVSR